MKKFGSFVVSIFAAGLFFINSASAESQALVSIFRDGVKFSESVYPYDGGLFISNYGSENMNPRADENSGYIIYRKDGINKKVAEGLHKPTGLLVKDNLLFVCDETKLLVYNLKNLSETPRVINFAADDKVANALTSDGENLYISITNTGRIYKLDIRDTKNLKAPKLWLEIPGPNGMIYGGGEIFIVSIPADYKSVTSENVVYRVKNLQNPVAEKFFDVAGLYDGVTISDDLKTLYVSDWLTASVTAIDIKSKKSRVIYEEKGIGPADIAQSGGRLFIPELVGSRIIEIQIEN